MAAKKINQDKICKSLCTKEEKDKLKQPVARGRGKGLKEVV